ncbi:hypothetical protein EMMF5_004584 [Cystobasidiomycetes sp. EMM_F5]
MVTQSLPMYSAEQHKEPHASTSTNAVSSVTLTKKRNPSGRSWSSSKGKQRSASYGGIDAEGAEDLHAILAAEGGRPRSLRGLMAYLLLRSPLGFLRPKNLTARSRTTNLAVLLLLTILSVSLLYNVKFYLHEHPLKGERDRLPFSIRATMPLPQQNTGLVSGSGGKASSIPDDLNHMILVPGHSVWQGRLRSEADDSSQWILQKGQQNSVKTFIRHIIKAVELAVRDQQSLLVFSGGQTRIQASEAEATSYFRVARALDLYRQFEIPKRSSQGDVSHTDTPEAGQSMFMRATTEMYAMDSYQNLVFSLCRFKEYVTSSSTHVLAPLTNVLRRLTGRYPSRITVVGFGMKRSRFTDVFRNAVRWPLETFTYIGIDDSDEDGSSYVGEREHGLIPYQKDIYGCHGVLLAKRRARNPFMRVHPYFTSNPELRDLLEYCPSDGISVFPGYLPWDTRRLH